MKASAQPAAPLRAVLYLRQSISKEESISLELQESAGRDYCARMGYVVVGVEEDPGISGRTWNRPGVRKVMELVEYGDADVIVLWKWSRLSRARLDWAVAVDKVESAGGRIESATEPLDTTTAAGRLARGMLAEFAAFESERIGDGWKETQARRLRQGLPHTGTPRFGYVKVAKDTYEPDPYTAPILAEAYRLYVEEEWGWTKIVRWLNGAGVPTITGTSKWDAAKIRSVMDAGFGAGVLAVGYRSKDVTYLPGAHPAIISEDLWASYRRLRSDRHTTRPAPQARALLIGMIKCDDCGSGMRSHSRGRGQRPGARSTPGYICNAALAFKDGRRAVGCTQSAVHGAVRAWVEELAADVDALAAAEVRVAERKVARINNAAAVQRRLEKARGSLGMLTVKWVEGKLTEDAYQAAASRLQDEIERLSAVELKHEPNPIEEVDIRHLAVRVTEIWDQATTEELRRALRTMIAEIRVIPPIERQSGKGTTTFRIIPAWDSE